MIEHRTERLEVLAGLVRVVREGQVGVRRVDAEPPALHLGDLAELAALAAPDDAAVHQVRAEVNEARAAAEPSLMAQGVFRWAARESRRVSP